MSGKQGWVALVGAGCGPADLITLRGKELLSRCDVVVYDDLIAPGLLDFAPQAEQIYMGKRQGRHSTPQEEICERLISLARAGKGVVRLKGGDPFVFGRGGEEALALGAAGISCQVVPGISSAIAIPAEAGIPVTHRGLARSFHVVTAHTAGEGLPPGLAELARCEGTLVFLMGLSRLEGLCQGLMEYGKDPDTPAAVLSGGNAPRPMAVRGPLSEVAERARRAGVQPPAIFLVGETAGLELPLTGGLDLPRVGITGTPALLDKLSRTLREAGLEPVPLQTLRVTPQFPKLPWDTWAATCPWLVFTSANGVRAFRDRLAAERVDLRRLAGCSFAVLGPGTGQALTDCLGVYPDLMPGTYSTAALSTALRARLAPGEPVVLLRSALGDRELREELSAAHPVEEYPLYTLTPGTPDLQRAAGCRYLVFSSASGVRSWFSQGGTLPPGCRPAAIGPQAARALREYWRGSILTPPKATAASVARLLAGLEKD